MKKFKFSTVFFLALSLSLSLVMPNLKYFPEGKWEFGQHQ